MNIKKIIALFILYGLTAENQRIFSKLEHENVNIKKENKIEAAFYNIKLCMGSQDDNYYEYFLEKIKRDGEASIYGKNLSKKQLKIIIDNLIIINEKYKIKTLRISNNPELEDVPDNIEQLLESIEELDISENNITEYPKSISKLKNLKSLDLSNNNLKFIPAEISKLENLNLLDLSQNSGIVKVFWDNPNKKPPKIIGKYFPINKLTASIVIILETNPNIRNKDAILIEFNRCIKQKVPILATAELVTAYSKKTIESFFSYRQINRLKTAYDIYHIENFNLYLFLPKDIIFKNAFNLDNANKISYDELKTITNSVTNNILDGIESIFKNRTDIWWNIVLRGHGNRSNTIAGLSSEKFKKFIEFLNNPKKINVYFFYYATCVGGGKRFIEPYITKYEDIKPVRFTIVSGSTREVSSTSLQTNYKKMFYILDRLLNFSKNSINIEKDPINYLLSIIKKEISNENLSSNFPLIKFPNSKVFISVRKDTRVKIINYTLLQKYKIEKKSIIIPKNINVIFVYPNIIDVPIKIENGSTPLIVSLDPGPSIHFFTEIEIEKKDIMDALNLFKEKEKEIYHEGHYVYLGVEYKKLFLIKKFKLNDSVHNIHKIYNDVLISPKEQGISMKRAEYHIAYNYNNNYYEPKSLRNENRIDKNTFQENTVKIINNVVKRMHILNIAPWRIKLNELINYINKELNLDITTNLLQKKASSMELEDKLLLHHAIYFGNLNIDNTFTTIKNLINKAK